MYLDGLWDMKVQIFLPEKASSTGESSYILHKKTKDLKDLALWWQVRTQSTQSGTGGQRGTQPPGERQGSKKNVQ